MSPSVFRMLPDRLPCCTAGLPHGQPPLPLQCVFICSSSGRSALGLVCEVETPTPLCSMAALPLPPASCTVLAPADLPCCRTLLTLPKSLSAALEYPYGFPGMSPQHCVLSKLAKNQSIRPCLVSVLQHWTSNGLVSCWWARKGGKGTVKKEEAVLRRCAGKGYSSKEECGNKCRP